MNIAKVIPDSSGTLGREVQNAIGKQLQVMYEDMVKQAVPERFLELLQKLDQRETMKDNLDAQQGIGG